MSGMICSLIFAVIRGSDQPMPPNPNTTRSDFALAVHGGAGTISRGGAAGSRTMPYHEGLSRALAAGRAILAAGGRALDAVAEAVVSVEDNPLFNAGRGSCFTAAGTQEMDASVMDGKGRRAGAVAGILGPRNPVLAARAVMERSRHVLLIGEGALALCRAHALAVAEPEYFPTETRWRRMPVALGPRTAAAAWSRSPAGARGLCPSTHPACIAATSGPTGQSTPRSGTSHSRSGESLIRSNRFSNGPRNRIFSGPGFIGQRVALPSAHVWE